MNLWRKTMMVRRRTTPATIFPNIISNPWFSWNRPIVVIRQINKIRTTFPNIRTISSVSWSVSMSRKPRDLSSLPVTGGYGTETYFLGWTALQTWHDPLTEGFLVDCQAQKHWVWTYFWDPLQLQGEMNSLEEVLSSRQNLHLKISLLSFDVNPNQACPSWTRTRNSSKILTEFIFKMMVLDL